MNRVLAWTIGAALAAGALVITALTPPESAVTAPFVVDAAIGERATGREVAVTVGEVTRAASVSEDPDDPAIEGRFLVVTLTADAVTEPQSNWFSLTVLEIDGLTYTISRRLGSLFISDRLQPGLPLTGSLVFELPEELEATKARLVFTQESNYPELDSMLRVGFDLDELPTAERVDVSDPERAVP